MIQRLLIGLVKLYRLTLSPWIGGACRFEPTCSIYAIEALQRHGAGAGTYLMVARIARCQPWGAGGHDPVPDRKPRLFTRWANQPTPTRKTPWTTFSAPSSG